MYNPAYPETENTICLDFDGVIHNDDKGYHDGTIYGEPIEGTKEALEEMTYYYKKIIICSVKARKDRPLINGMTGCEMIWKWLEKWNLRKYIDDVTAEKPPASKYVDDKGYFFNNWYVAMQILRMSKKFQDKETE